MKITKRELKREKMQRFTEQVETERQRLEGLDTRELIEHFSCGSFPVELAAAYVVHARGKAAAMDEVLAGLNHPKWKVRRTCANFMDHWGDSRCVEPLVNALRDPKEHVRRLALHSLTCQECKECPLEGDFVEPLVERALTDRSMRVRRIATGALGNFTHDERALIALRQILSLDQDPVLVARAQSALDRQGNGGLMSAYEEQHAVAPSKAPC